ncbi:hypothetical protein [Mycolicibacterium sp.]|uniref:hypothetical protein n=1 Tax=Mycolicibacterium sp. TaxID=2320850 RepID=UPI001A1E4727|nr:hypothetical protein [Mycolicibacterium sp.]MBJ7339724.1 hypothetical protein [Mycolicibacterium sp.]
MAATRSRTTALLTTAGAMLAAAAVIYAPVAAADDTIACEPGQIVIDGNCSVPGPPPQDDSAPAANDFFAPAPMDNGGGDSVDIGTGGIDVATGGVDIGGGGVDVGGGHR